MKYGVSVFIFRRDLRLHDNTALISALENSERVIPVFIFDDAQRNHDYFSENAFEFMVNSLVELQKKLKSKGADLLVFQGSVVGILEDLKESVGFDALFLNLDYTPFSRKRDVLIENFCKSKGVDFCVFHDVLLNPPGAVLNQQGEMYKVFTAFFREARNIDVLKPVSNKFKNYFFPRIPGSKLKFVDLNVMVSSSNPDLFVKGGRSEGLFLLESLKDKLDYSDFRDVVGVDATSRLSAHLKFGTLSIREVYWFINDNFFFGHSLISQFYWRDFFYHVAFFNPHVFGSAFKEKFNKIEWWGSDADFKAWREGKTGFPLVDAAMRQLNKTGWMHGRARMVVASFLVKNLGVDWRRGEKYFAQKLVDYDPCLNNGNWQWVASTGCDAQPFFRIFNPLLQQQKFDADCSYIKKHVLELRDLPAKEIHNVFSRQVSNYSGPVVDYKESVVKSKFVFSKAFRG